MPEKKAKRKNRSERNELKDYFINKKRDNMRRTRKKDIRYTIKLLHVARV